jgi:hypothetical protein
MNCIHIPSFHPDTPRGREESYIRIHCHCCTELLVHYNLYPVYIASAERVEKHGAQNLPPTSGDVVVSKEQKMPAQALQRRRASRMPNLHSQVMQAPPPDESGRKTSVPTGFQSQTLPLASPE